MDKDFTIELARVQGHLEGRMSALEAMVKLFIEDFSKHRDRMEQRFDEREEKVQSLFAKMDAKLDEINEKKTESIAFVRGAKWVIVGVGLTAIWLVEHLNSIIPWLKALFVRS